MERKSKSPIVMTWTDGGIRPPHPDIIPANSDIGGQDSLNGVLMIGDKGIISTNINDSSPLMPKLYLYDGETEFGPEVEEMLEPEYGIKENGLMHVKQDLIVKNT